MTDGCSHLANLPVAPFPQCEFQPGGRQAFPPSDGDGARRQIGASGKQPDARREHGSSFDVDRSLPQSAEGCFLRNSFHLNKVGSLMAEPRVGQAMGEYGIVGEQKQAFAVCIESSGRIDAGRKRSERRKRLMRSRMKARTKLAENAIRFVEGNADPRS
jgi:hypothetical protein